MSQFNFEFWTAGNDACQRVSIMAACHEHAKQIVIGRYAPTALRRF